MRRNTVITTLLLVSGVILSSTIVSATAPPRPGEIEHLRAKGKLAERLAFAEALGNHHTAPELVRRFRRSLVEMDLAESATAQKSLPPSLLGHVIPSTGDVRTFMLLIDFDGHPHQVPAADAHEIIYGEGDPWSTSTRSMKNYYDRSSYGLVDLSNGATLGWFTSSYSRDLLDTAADREAVIGEAIEHFDAEGHDFSQYDNDGDGDIDYFIVCWTGPSGEWASFWWAYYTGWSGSAFVVDGKTLSEYSWQWESRGASTIIHETGHAFGLPDLYDYDEDVGPSGGAGFDMMDSTSYDHNCFSKWMLGWLEPTVVSGATQNLTLDDTASSPECVLIWPTVSTSDIFSEFFLVQNRQDEGNDSSFHRVDGLAIWHIDSTLSSVGSFLFNNSTTPHKLVRLMEADGLEDIEANEYWQPDDLYGYGDDFGWDTFPSSARYDGFDSCVSVWNIVDLGDEDGDPISASFNASCTCPTTPAATAVTAPPDGAYDVTTTPVLNWDADALAVSYAVELCDDVDCLHLQRTAVVTASSWAVSPALKDGKTFYWRVRANGECAAGGWSETRSFSTICEDTSLDAPVLLWPDDGASDADLIGPLWWEYDPNVESYLVDVCSDPACNDVIRSKTLPPSDNAATIGNRWDISPGLAGLTEYWWRIKASVDCRESGWSPIRSFTTRAETGIPVLLYPADDAVGVELQPVLKWQAVEGALFYDVKVCYHLDDWCSDPLREGSTTDTEWLVEPWPVSEEKSYPWSVRAVTDWGFGDWAELFTMHTCTSLAPPDKNSYLPATGSTDVSLSPTLMWDPREGADTYEVEVCTYSACTEVIRTASTYLSSWTVDPPLEMDTKHHWRVRSRNACGAGDWLPHTFENPNFTTVGCPTPVDPPTTTSPIFGAIDVSVTPVLYWHDPASPATARPSTVEVCSEPSCDTAIRSISLTAADQWLLGPELDPSTQYWWRVKFVNACGDGPWSIISNFITEDCPPPAEPDLSDPGDTTPSGSTYTLAWAAGAGTVSYKVQESTDRDFLKGATTTYTTAATSMDFSHVNTECADEQYFYRVRADTDCSTSAWSRTVDMWVDLGGMPSVPTGLSPSHGATAQSPTLTLDWDDDAAAENFEVIVCEGRTCIISVRSATVADSDWTVTPALDEFTSYSWKVRAGNRCGDSAWSPTFDFDTGCAVPDQPAPTDPGDHVASGVSYTLSWPAVNGATAYQLQEATDPEFTRPSSFTEDKITSMDFSHVNNGCTPVTYYYRMVAAGDCGVSDISATVDMAVDGSGILPTPSLLLPTDGATAVDTDAVLDWEEESAADDYLVQVCDDRDCLSVIRSATVTDSEWTVDPALDEYATVWWKVQAGNNCMDSSWSEIRSFVTGCNLPAVPKVLDPGLTVASGQTYVVSWNTVSDATGYSVYEANNPSFLNATWFAASDRETSMAFAHDNTSCAPVTYYYQLVAHNSCGDSEPSQLMDMVVTGLIAGETCSTGLDGVCSQGITECRNDEIVCTQITQPSAELCDGLDNDCNPATTDGFAEIWLGAACDGLDADFCQEGRLSCERATRTCTDYTDSTREICGDGIDNDCDGVVDCLGYPIFTDGFESGDPSRWSMAAR